MDLAIAATSGVTSGEEEQDQQFSIDQGGPASWAAERTVRLEIASLMLGDSPRRDGVDPSHVRTLVEQEAGLPPILVHRETMRVLDGAHRVQAAKRRGEAEIDATLFEGDAETAFVVAVQANIAHGLPLSLADRRAAAGRILLTHPQWSDRAIAAATGLSATTVRTIRDSQPAECGSVPAARIGRDGRRRPIDAEAGRWRAATVIGEHPDASLRTIARSAGISVGTARDVRDRLQKGESPVPTPHRRAVPAATSNRVAATTLAAMPEFTPADAAPRPPSAILENLKCDPSLRYSETGRIAIRWLSARFVDPSEWSRFADALPAHCAYSVAEFAVACARVWEQIAAELIDRTQTLETSATTEPIA